MKNIQKIKAILERMVTLLRLSEDYDWANAIENLREQISIDPVEAVYRIRSLYGGMGSLNDIVLYKNGQPFVAENNEFYAMKIELYDLCSEMSHPSK
jgi:hypothetical protein